ncbi:MAG: AraC family transcriptional regulator [Acutalibacter sp.]
MLFFLLVMAIPVFSQSVSNIQVEDVLRQNAREQTLASLGAAASGVDRVRQDVDNMLYNMENNSEIARFLQLRPLDMDKTIVSDVLKAQRQLSTYKITNSNIGEIQLYAFQSGILVDTTTSALEPSKYYGVNFSMGNMAYSQWTDSVLRREHTASYVSAKASFANTEGEYLLYMQTIPAGLYSGNVMVYLEKEKLLSQFQSIQYGEGGMVGILDSQGLPLLLDNPGELDFVQLNLNHTKNSEGSFVQRVDGQTFLVFYYTSSLGDWTYFAALPQQAVLAPSQEIQRFLMAMILVSLVVSGMLALYFAGKTSRPVATITGLLSRNNQFPSPGELPTRIARLLETNQSLRETVHLHMDSQRVVLLYRLLSGSFHDEEEIKSEFLQVGLHLEAPYFCLLLVAMPGLTHSGSKLEGAFAYKQLVKEVLTQKFEKAVGICDVDLHRCLLLLPGEGEPQGMCPKLELQAKEVLEQLSPAVEGGLAFSACFAEGLVQIPASFSRLQNFDSLWEEGQPITWVSQEMGTETQAFFYPLSLELRLIAAVQDGRSAMVEDIFQLIEQQNRGCLALGGNGALLLLQALYGTLLRLVNECRSNSEALLAQCQQVGELGADCPVQERFWHTKECFLATAASYDSVKQDHHTDNLVEKIQRYLQDHFTDQQLSLTSAAEEFHITEPYLSRIFKQGTGENFSKYVERLRMEKAKELISTGGIKLSEVAQQVGYNSPQVFRRVYKKNFGVSPSEDMKG